MAYTTACTTVQAVISAHFAGAYCRKFGMGAFSVWAVEKWGAFRGHGLL